MKCPICGRPGEVLRVTGAGARALRYCVGAVGDRHRYVTLEVKAC